MTVTTLPALLDLSVQDLHAGCRAAAERLPEIATHATDPELRALLSRTVESATRRGDRLAATGRIKDDGPENLWMKGILDDSQRDTQSIAAGDPLDIATIGAVRKAIAAERVSIDTGAVLADRLECSTTREALRANAAALDDLDAQFTVLLGRLAGAP